MKKSPPTKVEFWRSEMHLAVVLYQTHLL